MYQRCYMNDRFVFLKSSINFKRFQDMSICDINISFLQVRVLLKSEPTETSASKTSAYRKTTLSAVCTHPDNL